MGRPIRVKVSGSLTATAAPKANQPTNMLRITGLAVELPVYPDGPVTVALPVTATSGVAHIAVSYAACSANTCLIPVSGHVVDLPVT
jgi:hypothetical protein